MLSCLGKLFTSILNRRLTQFAEENEIFNNCQFGFREGRSTIDCIFILHAAIEHCLQNGEMLFCSFVDLKMAFDKTSRRATCFKCHQNKISNKIINIIKSMYSKMKMCISNAGNSIHVKMRK